MQRQLGPDILDRIFYELAHFERSDITLVHYDRDLASYVARVSLAIES
jgi:hypothetical protein